MPPALSALVAVFQSASPPLPVDAELVAEQPARVTTAAAARARPARVRLYCTGRCLSGGVRCDVLWCAAVAFGAAAGAVFGVAFGMIVDAAGFAFVLRR